MSLSGTPGEPENTQFHEIEKTLIDYMDYCVSSCNQTNPLKVVGTS